MLYNGGSRAVDDGNNNNNYNNSNMTPEFNGKK